MSIEWIDGKHVRAHVVGKAPIEIATPPEFKGEHPDVWSPEDFLVAAAASCFAVTFVAVSLDLRVAVNVEVRGRVAA